MSGVEIKTFLRATEFAVHAHAGQIRHWTNEPYVAHCIRVAYQVAMTGESITTITAALFHDVLEDCPQVTRSQIRQEFGFQVLEYVEALTDCVHAVGNRRRRKELDRARLADACREVQTIKCFDILDNLESIVKHDPGFAKNTFLPEVLKCSSGLTKVHTWLLDKTQRAIFDAIHSFEVYGDENVGC
jgi:(p)ppGpp synthase/HD superfamily hydrolase